MSTKDGGQAFPVPLASAGLGGMLHAGEPGMSLRDYFAGQALAAMAIQGIALEACIEWPDAMDMARNAYSIADAMLREKERTE